MKRGNKNTFREFFHQNVVLGVYESHKSSPCRSFFLYNVVTTLKRERESEGVFPFPLFPTFPLSLVGGHGVWEDCCWISTCLLLQRLPVEKRRWWMTIFRACEYIYVRGGFYEGEVGETREEDEVSVMILARRRSHTVEPSHHGHWRVILIPQVDLTITKEETKERSKMKNEKFGCCFNGD